jgi:hypothetical protein
MRDNGRKRSGALVGMILATLLVALGSYSLSARVAAEAKAAEGLGRSNAALARQVDALSDELRVRMRLPQLQRWNDVGFRMNPVSARQFLKTPVELGLYAPGSAPQMDRAPILVSAPAPPPALAPAPDAGASPPSPAAIPPTPPPGLLLAAAPAEATPAPALAPVADTDSEVLP